MKSLFIIHYQPIELYPPVLNLINTIQQRNSDSRIFILTTRSGSIKTDEFKASTDNIRTYRLGEIDQFAKPFSRYLNYLIFLIGSFFCLMLKRPAKLLYYETLSSFPVYLYKRFLKRNAEIYIHYHEYTSKQEYAKDMKLARLFHKYEKYLYPIAQWVSHTNEDRMEKFQDDIQPVTISKPFILPNYPPLKWSEKSEVHSEDRVKKVVYVGALGMDTMYIEEFARWVELQNGKLIWHIYSQQNAKPLLSFISSIQARNIEFKGAARYDELPEILNKYDVGVILYKGHIPNYIYNAPNKLFEYLACGLDVWFPIQMKGCFPYQTVGTFPKVVPLNFDNLLNDITTDTLSRAELKYLPSPYYCENVLPGLINRLL